MKFVALYMAPAASIDEMMKNSTPETQKGGMDAWMGWMEKHKANMAEMGAPLGKNERITKGGVSDMRNEVCGYSVIEAASQDEATKIFADCPHFELAGAYVDLMECVSM